MMQLSSQSVDWYHCSQTTISLWYWKQRQERCWRWWHWFWLWLLAGTVISYLMIPITPADLLWIHTSVTGKGSWTTKSFSKWGLQLWLEKQKGLKEGTKKDGKGGSAWIWKSWSWSCCTEQRNLWPGPTVSISEPPTAALCITQKGQQYNEKREGYEEEQEKIWDLERATHPTPSERQQWH